MSSVVIDFQTGLSLLWKGQVFQTLANSKARNHPYSTKQIGVRYKPLPLRLPCLLIFLAIFGTCIALMERLLATSRDMENLASNSTTSTSYIRGQKTIFCSKSSEFATQLERLESRYSSMCSNYSSLFAPSPTKNSPGQQSIFQDWSLSLYDMQLSQYSTEDSSRHCYESTAASPTKDASIYTTAGCTSTPLSESGNICGQGGYLATFEMFTGVLTATWSWLQAPCEEPHDKLLLIGTAADMTTVDITRTSSYHTILQTTNDAGSPTKVIKYVTTTITPSATVRANFNLSEGESKAGGNFTRLTYFLAVFFAPIVAVLIKILWEVVDAAFKLIEPFQRISTDQSVPLEDVFWTQYLSSGWSLQTIQALWRHKAQSLWLLAMFVLVQISAPLASAATSVRAQNICQVGRYQMRCNPVWIINQPVIRSLEAIMGTCAALLIVLILATWTYGFDVPGNPSSIASVASMLDDESLLHVLRQVSPDAGTSEWTHTLASQHHMLTLLPTSPSRVQLRLTMQGDPLLDDESSQNHHLLEAVGSGNQTSTGQKDHYVAASAVSLARSIDHEYQRDAQKVARHSGLATDILSLAAISTLLGILIAYHLDKSSSPFNTFFSSQSIISKVVFVGLAVIADVQFKSLEHDVRVIEPYRRLSQGHARPETTILLYLDGTCWSNLPQCIYYLFWLNDSRMLWQAVVTIVACLSDFNIIAIPGVMFSDAQTQESLLACWYISITITSLMLVVVLVGLVWWRRVDVVRNMPRRPGTIGAVASYLCGSTMTNKIASRAESKTAASARAFSEKTEWKSVVREGERFRFGRWVSPIDECVRWSVEYEVETADVWS